MLFQRFMPVKYILKANIFHVGLSNMKNFPALMTPALGVLAVVC